MRFSCSTTAGFGNSEGERGLVFPMCDRLRISGTALPICRAGLEVDPNRIGLFGSAGTGGSLPIYVAAIDHRVKCIVSNYGFASGEEWLRRMRREHEWIAFRKRLESDRQKRVLEGQGELVNPHEELMVATPERAQAGVKKDVDSRIPDRVPLRSAEAIMEFKPENYVAAISRAALFIATEGDAVTPEDQMIRLYEKAGSPKKLILQKETSHPAAYSHTDRVTPIIDWYDRYLKYDVIEVRERTIS